MRAYWTGECSYQVERVLIDHYQSAHLERLRRVSEGGAEHLLSMEIWLVLSFAQSFTLALCTSYVARHIDSVKMHIPLISFCTLRNLASDMVDD
jgi:hypothetical protein